jgi:hypothetical protein
MPAKNKKTIQKRTVQKKAVNKRVVLAAKSTFSSRKLKKANKILANMVWMDHD